MDITYGVDWISATSDDQSTGERWWLDYCAYCREYGRLFEDTFHMQGGYTGVVNDGLTWAYSKSQNRFFCQGTGATSLNALTIISGCANTRITRIDLRVDVHLDKVDADVAGRAYDANKDSQKPKYRLIDGSGDDGQTLYVGSQASDVFGRLYDKSAERKQGVGLHWRYEVVIRKPHSQAVYEQLSSGGITQITGIVHAWFDGRNVKPIFGADAIGINRANKAETSLERKLEWMRKSVRPTVCKLVEGGYAQEVFDALGISTPRLAFRETEKPT